MNLSISARAVAGTNPLEGCSFRASSYMVLILVLNLARVRSQPSSSSFVSLFFADPTGSYLRAFCAGRPVRLGPDEDATGVGREKAVGKAFCETGQATVTGG